MITANAQAKRTILVRLSSGEDILTSLREAVQRENIKNAIILSAFGAVSTYHFHVVATSALPPGELFPKGDKALDVVGMSGAVIDGRVHAHILFTDDVNAMGGHLEPGCTVLTFLIVTMQEVDNVTMTDWDRFKMKA